MIKKSIITIAALAILLGGWRVGSRRYVLRKLYRFPETTSRVQVVPTELDLSTVSNTHGATCDVGYAEFVIACAQPIDLTLSRVGAGIRGTSKTLLLGLVPPFDPSSPDANSFKQEFRELPLGHPIRQRLASTGSTLLDFEIYTERSMPDPLWKAILLNRADFILNTTFLAIKAGNVGGGMHSVHTYQTSDTRGLIRIGRTTEDKSMAHVYIENRSRTQGVGMILQLHDKEKGDVMNMLPTLLKTFRFTVEHLDSGDEARRLITQAGIQPAEQQEDRPTTTSILSSEGAPSDER